MEDMDLVDVQVLVPTDHTLDVKKARLLNDMLWGTAWQNAANHWSAQQHRAQRKQNYEELEEGGENQCCRVPRQLAAVNILLLPEIEGPPIIVTNNFLDTIPPVNPCTAEVFVENVINGVDNNNDLISLGDEF
jgi:hypothetical protein